MNYKASENEVCILANIMQRRPLSEKELLKLQRELAKMLMVCDAHYILDLKTSPNIEELDTILDTCLSNPKVKTIVFSEWERMLHLVADLCNRRKLNFGWHTGTVPQAKRRAEINRFKSDPECRLFLSTDSGSTGLNLQNASVVIQCDLP